MGKNGERVLIMILKGVGWGEAGFMAEIMRVLGWVNIFLGGRVGFLLEKYLFIYSNTRLLGQFSMDNNHILPPVKECECEVGLKWIRQLAAPVWSVQRGRKKLHWLFLLHINYSLYSKLPRWPRKKPRLEREGHELFNLAWMLLELPCWVSTR